MVPSRHPWLQGHSSLLGQRSNLEHPVRVMVVGRRIWRTPRSPYQELERLVCAAPYVPSAVSHKSTICESKQVSVVT
ncbi:MAG TPA: hypothetical protein VMV58_00785, partial [Desulfosporosinus sp.]|nr:hypothetical protein [Desulfosporosinus sp.]